MNISNFVSERIKQLCDENGITVNRLATISGVSQSTINDIVVKKSQNMGIVTLKKICDAFDISMHAFFEEI